MRRCFAFHISGDQHLGCVAQYGLDDWRDASVAFCVPSIVNYYPRKWLPTDPAARPLEGALPNLGDYTEGLGNKLTMFTYANPTAFPAPLTNLAASASGHRSPADMWKMSKALSAPGYEILLFPSIYTYVPVYGRARKIVVIHDATVDRTTNGSGNSVWTLPL